MLLLAPIAAWSLVVAACGDGDDQAVASQESASTEPDTSAAPLESDSKYCGGPTGAGLTAEALSYSGSAQPENEGAWVMSAAGLAALDPQLHEARTDGDVRDEQVFVVPVADGKGRTARSERTRGHGR